MNQQSKSRKLSKSIKNIIKKPDFYLILAFVSINFFTTYIALIQNGVGHKITILIIELLLEGALIFTLFRSKTKKQTIEKKYLLFAVLLGAILLIFLPPGQAPDEQNHFRRAYGVARGDFIIESGSSQLPDDISDSLHSMPEKGTYRRILANVFTSVSTNYTEQKYTNTAIYNPICYLPQILAALIGRIFNLSILATAYLMEIFNYAAYVMLIYWAIKIIPKFKAFIVFLALSPMALQESVSLAPDALTIGLCLFLIAFVCHIAYERKNVISKRELIILYAMAVILGFCKIVYLPLVLLYFLIPAERFGTKKRKVTHAICIAVAVAALNGAWLLASSKIAGDGLREGVNTAVQLSTILRNPLGYLKLMLVTTNELVFVWLDGVFGLSLGAFVVNFPTIYRFIALIVFIVLVAQRNERIEKMPNRDRIIMASIFILISSFILTVEFLQWTPAGAPIIEGVQGRYFIPFILLLPLAFNRKRDSSQNMNLITENRIILYCIFLDIAAAALFLAQNA